MQSDCDNEGMAKKNNETGFGPPPTELGTIGVFRWNEISEILAGRGIDGVEFRGPLLILCQAYEDHAEARANIKAIGTTIVSERGTTRNPDCLNVNNAAGTIAKLSAQFGLTPASQGKLKLKKKEESNPFADL
jgi:P27 family predicted phage terminase small subunit